MVKLLTNEELKFFSNFTRSVMVNPFTEERRLLHTLVTSKYLTGQSVGVHFFKSLQPLLTANIAELEKRNLTTFQQFNGQERKILYFSYIAEVYLDYIEPLDDLIKRQLASKTSSVTFPEGEPIIAKLVSRGFIEKEALSLLELLYQFRRAYLFINTGLVGQCDAITRLRESLWNNLFTSDVFNYHRSLWDNMEDFSVFLVGETGTGKGAAAFALGRSVHITFDRKTACFSENFNQTFISANLSQFAENLIESELFGHRKGAFTGAVEQHKGLFSQCNSHGLLFLDEIGNLSQNIQIKLLKVLQERKFVPVGSYIEESFHGRIVAAANQSLHDLRKDEMLRDDFYYRLCSDVIEIPSLRQRINESKNELEILVAELVSRICGNKDDNIVDRVLTALAQGLPKDYYWPGNVRELEQAIRRVILSGSYLGDRFHHQHNDVGSMPQFNREHLDLKDFSKRYCFKLYQQLGSYEAVAKKTNLDRRTVKKYILESNSGK
ncbi:response regulator receiver protein [Thalassotalea sp. ND16A]|nr:response regulator receiver protein [Thalassotalea sp. ND16A]